MTLWNFHFPAAERYFMVSDCEFTVKNHEFSSAPAKFLPLQRKSIYWNGNTRQQKAKKNEKKFYNQIIVSNESKVCH